MTTAMQKIKKFKEDTLKVVRQAIESVNPEAAVDRVVRLQNDRLLAGEKEYDLANYNNIHVIGAGKAPARKARPVASHSAKRLADSLLCTTKGHGGALEPVEVMEADHPVPGRNSQLAAERTLQLAEKCGPQDLIICVLSGGASAIWCAPYPPLKFEDKQRTTEELLKCGADIYEINVIRKHLSAIKGGRLARKAYPATVVTLAISDVIGDDLSTIGSGPTVGDQSTYEQASEIIEKYGLSVVLPASILDYINNGLKKIIEDTPGPDDSIFAENYAVVVASNKLALETARQAALQLGYEAHVYSSELAGEASLVGLKLVDKLRSMAGSRHPGGKPLMLLSGGETTVTIKGKGKGGRNQELALAAAIALDGENDIVAASVGTDGIDGFTDAAGAFADGTSVARGKAAGLDAEVFLANNNSYEYFDAIDDLIKTGPTGTNVMDIQVLIIG